MADYQLTPEADSDVLEIARYTIKTWGEQQAERYEAKLRRCFEAIASGRAKARELLKSHSTNEAIQPISARASKRRTTFSGNPGSATHRDPGVHPVGYRIQKALPRRLL
jgi:plasmid stabilization system protein ParE